LTIDGTAGSLKLNGEELMQVSEVKYGDRTQRLLDTSRSEQKNIEEFGKELAIASLEPFIMELEHFIDCVKNGKKPVTDGEVAKKTIDVIINAYQSERGNL
jgi:predicted dehydrogenase